MKVFPRTFQLVSTGERRPLCPRKFHRVLVGANNAICDDPILTLPFAGVITCASQHALFAMGCAGDVDFATWPTSGASPANAGKLMSLLAGAIDSVAGGVATTKLNSIPTYRRRPSPGNIFDNGGKWAKESHCSCRICQEPASGMS